MNVFTNAIYQSMYNIKYWYSTHYCPIYIAKHSGTNHYNIIETRYIYSYYFLTTFIELTVITQSQNKLKYSKIKDNVYITPIFLL